MNDEECGVVYEELIKTLRGLRMDWVADLAEDRIREGKLEDEYPIIAYHRASVFETESRSSSRSSNRFGGTSEYSPRERLEVLLDVIEESVIDPVQMVGVFFNWVSQDVNSMSFFDPEENTERFTVHAQDLSIKSNQAEVLFGLVEALRGGL